MQQTKHALAVPIVAVVIAFFVAIVGFTFLDTDLAEFFADRKDGLSAVTGLIQAVTVVAAATYAWYEFVYKQRERTELRAEPGVVLRSKVVAETQILMLDVTVANVGNATLWFDRRLEGRPRVELVLYDHPVVEDLAAHADEPLPVLPGLGIPMKAYPFADDELALVHHCVEAGATIRGSVSVVVPEGYGSIALASATFTFDGGPDESASTGAPSNESWTVDAAAVLAQPGVDQRVDLPRPPTGGG